MRNPIRFLLATTSGLMLAGFVMGAALADRPARPADATCPALTKDGASCPVLQQERAVRDLRLRTASSEISGDCPGLVSSCPASKSACPALRSCPGLSDSPAAGVSDIHFLRAVGAEECPYFAPEDAGTEFAPGANVPLIEVLSI